MYFSDKKNVFHNILSHDVLMLLGDAVHVKWALVSLSDEEKVIANDLT